MRMIPIRKANVKKVTDYLEILTAWYHIVVTLDTDTLVQQLIDVKIYVNGERETLKLLVQIQTFLQNDNNLILTSFNNQNFMSVTIGKRTFD